MFIKHKHKLDTDTTTLKNESYISTLMQKLL